MVKLYTLPTCGICHMVKSKMEQKGIPFQECNFEEIVNKINTDRAPVLEIDIDNYLMSPSEMVAWINNWEA